MFARPTIEQCVRKQVADVVSMYKTHCEIRRVKQRHEKRIKGEREKREKDGIKGGSIEYVIIYVCTINL